MAVNKSTIGRQAFQRTEFPDLTTYGALDLIAIRCPICQQTVHPELRAALPDEDDYDGTSYGWNGKGELIVIALWCEGCGDPDTGKLGSVGYSLLLGNHKGNCQLAFVREFRRPVRRQVVNIDDI